MKEYLVLQEFVHDGEKVLPGKKIKLDESLAKYLLRGQAIKPVEEDKQPPAKKEK